MINPPQTDATIAAMYPDPPEQSGGFDWGSPPEGEPTYLGRPVHQSNCVCDRCIPLTLDETRKALKTLTFASRGVVFVDDLVIGDPAEGAKVLEMWAKEWPEMARYAGIRKDP